jgi:hypothetical protein
MKSLHALRAPYAKSPKGERSFGIGFRFGWWPCVGGPYVQVGYGFGRVSVWWGTESEATNYS